MLHTYIYIALTAIFIGVAAWQHFQLRKLRRNFFEKEHQTHTISLEKDELENELASWKATFNTRVEQETTRRIRSWEPDPDVIRADFKYAEYMATKRKTIDAGRLHPPRNDGGPTGRISRMRVKTTRVKSTDPK